MNHLRLALTLLLVIGATATLSACAGVVRDQGWSTSSQPQQRATGGRD